MRLIYFLPLIFLGCGDETISGYANPAATYHLTELEGRAFTARATISFPRQGQVEGDGPCNHWSATQSAPYPWFELGPIAATRRACIDLSEEQRFFEALDQMTLAEVQGPILILSNDQGQEMVFQAE